MARTVSANVASALVILAATVTVASSARAQVPPRPGQTDSAKTAAIQSLMEATRVADLMVEAIEMSFSSQRAALPQLPDSLWDELTNRMTTEIPAYLDSLVPVYARLLSLDEIEQLSEFYTTALGQRLLEITPALLRESTEIGRRWGERIAAEIIGKPRD